MKQREILITKHVWLVDGRIDQLALKRINHYPFRIGELDKEETDLVSLIWNLNRFFRWFKSKVFGQALQNLLIGLVVLLPFMVLGIIGYLIWCFK